MLLKKALTPLISWRIWSRGYECLRNYTVQVVTWLSPIFDGVLRCSKALPLALNSLTGSVVFGNQMVSFSNCEGRFQKLRCACHGRHIPGPTLPNVHCKADQDSC